MNFKKKIVSFFALISTLVVGAFSFVSCGNKDDGKFIDYVNTSNVRLNRDYKTEDGKNRDFFTNGVSEVTLVNSIDGDTAHFRMKDNANKTTIKSRFYGVDTPESTMIFEDYGFAASRFTKEKLKDAKTIVISASTTKDNVPPTPDSSGSRYLSMVWISEEESCPYNELKLLNLWLVQEGLSTVHKLLEFPDFAETFAKAEEQAKMHKLNLFSGVPDPEMARGQYAETSIFDIKAAMDDEILNGTPNPYHLKNVKIDGTVVGYVNNSLYLQDSRLKDDGTREYASINIFTGMGAIPTAYTVYGTRLRICGTAKSDEGFGFQISDVADKFPEFEDDNPTHTKIIMPAEEALTNEEYAPKDYKLGKDDLSEANRMQYVNSKVTVNGKFKVTGGYENKDNQLTKVSLDLVNTEDSNFKIKVFLPFLYRPFDKNPNFPVIPKPNSKYTKWDAAEKFKGSIFTVSGVFTVRRISSGKFQGQYDYQVTPKTNQEFVLVELAGK